MSRAVKHDIAIEYYNLGNAYYQLNQFEKAVEYFEKALEYDPKLLKSHFNLSLALIKSGKSKEAVELLNTLLIENPDSLDILSLLGYAYYSLNDYENALIVFEKILSISPLNLEALYNTGIIFWKTGETARAEKCFLDVLSFATKKDDYKKDSIFVNALFDMGDLLLQEERWEESIVYILRYLEVISDDEKAYLVIGGAFTGLEKYHKAIEYYKKLLEINKENTEAWVRLAFIYFTKIEDPYNGFLALKTAVQLGFKDTERLILLLIDPGVIEKPALEKYLIEKGLVPKNYNSVKEKQKEE